MSALSSSALCRRPLKNIDPRAGQSLIESCLVLAVVCLVLFGLFQISQLLAAKEVLLYSAGKAARAKTVGFNRFMVEKTVKVGTIPNAGRMTNPDPGGGPALKHAMESARIPLYLAAENAGRLRAILEYADWDSIGNPRITSMGNGTLRVQLSQDYPMRFPFYRLFYAADRVPLEADLSLDEHYPLYLDDWGW